MLTIIKAAIIFLLIHIPKGIWSKTGEEKEREKGGRKAKVAQSYACYLKDILLHVY